MKPISKMKKNLRLRAILLLITVTIAGSCTRETETDRMDMNQNISFIPDWSGETKAELTKAESTISDETISATVLNLNGDIEAYLHATTTQGIDLGNEIDSDVVSDPQQTKAAPVTDETMYDKFGVSAYRYTGTWSEDKTPNFFHNIQAALSGGSYVLTPSYPWPGSSYKLRFFAYAPKYNSQYVISPELSVGSPTISATIPSDVSKQICLLVAKSGELNGDNNTPVSLTFDHTLTAVKFVCGKDMQRGSVKSITLKNVYSTGVYNMGTASWSNQGTPATFTQELRRSITGAEGEAVTTESETFMMLPQSLPDNAQVEVVFTDSTNTDHTLTATLQGQTWTNGSTVTYTLSSSPINWTYTLDVTAPLEFEYTGGTNTYTVTSYRENGNGVKEAVKWRAEYSIDNGNTWSVTRPDWLTAFTDSGNGGPTSQSYNAIVIAETGAGNTHTNILKNTTPKGSSGSPYNLSNSTGASSVENTANCYVVNAPGYYCFPLVYGNAIKNGATNSSAYSTTVSNPTSEEEGETLKNFLNHAGEIKGPYIDATNDCNPSKAELVWQDAPSLVTNIKYNSGSNGGTISFEVNRSSIKQGNAVIAVKDESNTVLWSWHIWVTDRDINSSIAVTNHDGVVYNFMPVNLGWCDGEGTATYPESICKVRFMATEGAGIVKEIMIRRKSSSVVTGGYSPYYQFGRKDPFQPSDGITTAPYKTKTWYNSTDASSTANPTTENLGTGSSCIMKYIKQPNVFNTTPYGDNLYSNLWSANNNEGYTFNNNTVVKTIYDPSPVGYHMPASAAFTGFTTTGTNTNTLSEVKGSWDNTNKGWNFPANGGKTIYFPASGYRAGSDGGSLYSVFITTHYLSAVPFSVRIGCSLNFGSSYVAPESSRNRSYGFPVRPVGEYSSSPINWTYTLDVTAPLEFEYSGGTNTYTVTSYRENGNGVKEAVKWRAEYSIDNGNTWSDTRPDWLTAFTDSGNGGPTYQSYNATVVGQIGETDNIHTISLRNEQQKGSVGSPYDLSTHDLSGASTPMNTANCYVVNAPGYYSFPLVYGNAIKNGNTNISAYTTTVSNPTSGGGETLKNFLNHAGEIKGPYIDATNDCNPSKAELVWQDAPSLVTNIKYNSGSNGGTISFEVNRSSIQQGNAVIAVKDESNTVLWSWHIWVTDENINSSIAVNNHDNVTYNFMPVNLGWCDGGTTTYPESICKVRFMATEGADIVKEITIRRKSGSVVTKGNNPYYQWGRKDPFQPSDGKGNTTKTWYNGNNTSSPANPTTEDLGTGSSCIMKYIKQPNVFNGNIYGDNLYSNLWSANNNVYTMNNNTVVKTIYDPSPVGYHMPASAAFTGFTTTGTNTNTLSEVKGSWDNTNGGYNFTANGGKTIYFPASGCRFGPDGSLYRVLSDGIYWSAVPSYVGSGRSPYFSSPGVGPEFSHGRYYDFPVRPVGE